MIMKAVCSDPKQGINNTTFEFTLHVLKPTPNKVCTSSTRGSFTSPLDLETRAFAMFVFRTVRLLASSDRSSRDV